MRRRDRTQEVLNYFKEHPDATWMQCSRDIHASPTTISVIMKQQEKDPRQKTDIEYIIDDLNKTINETKDKEAFLMFFYPTATESDLISHSVIIDNVNRIELVPNSNRYVKIIYKSSDFAFMKFESLLEIYACIHPITDNEKIERKKDEINKHSQFL